MERNKEVSLCYQQGWGEHHQPATLVQGEVTDGGAEEDQPDHINKGRVPSKIYCNEWKRIRFIMTADQWFET